MMHRWRECRMSPKLMHLWWLPLKLTKSYIFCRCQQALQNLPSVKFPHCFQLLPWSVLETLGKVWTVGHWFILSKLCSWQKSLGGLQKHRTMQILCGPPSCSCHQSMFIYTSKPSCLRVSHCREQNNTKRDAASAFFVWLFWNISFNSCRDVTSFGCFLVNLLMVSTFSAKAAFTFSAKAFATCRSVWLRSMSLAASCRHWRKLVCACCVVIVVGLESVIVTLCHDHAAVVADGCVVVHGAH